MKRRDYLFLLLLLVVLILVGCAHTTNNIAEITDTYGPVESSLTNINQKIASHFVEGIPNGFGRDTYVEAVKTVCHDNPVCLSQANAIIEQYRLEARKVDDMFSVMLCDKETNQKIMEDFSCNDLRVEVQTWKTGRSEKCVFEDDWHRVEQNYCGE
jgi:hypothetical protein